MTVSGGREGDTVCGNNDKLCDQNGYVVEQACSKGQIAVRCFNLEVLHQTQNSFATDKDP